MSTERDELAEVIATAIDEWFGEGDPNEYVAHAVRAAGYRKPRTVTIAEELDALPVGSVVLDKHHDAWKLHHRMERPDKTWRTHWVMADFSDALEDSEALEEFLPATVLHEGSPE